MKATKLSQEFDYAAFRERYGGEALPLFVVNESGSLVVCTAEKKLSPKAGQTLISLVDPQRATPADTQGKAAAEATAAEGDETVA